MSRTTFIERSIKSLLHSMLLILTLPLSTLAADDMVNILPPVSCGTGWVIEGKPALYDRDTLSDRINGEAELYFPYGFDRMIAGRYSSRIFPGAGMDVEIYRMGTVLDAFGMYANYRQKDGLAIAAGAEASLSGSQLFFYKGNTFIHIQITGTDAAVTGHLTECAKAVDSRMPGVQQRPSELSVFDRAEVIKGTERYIPQSLLGYDFLNRGIIADAVVEGINLQVFLLLGTAVESASTAFERYRAQIADAKIEKGGKASYLSGIDPLYGPVMVISKGNCLAGALRFGGGKGIRAFLESVCR